MIDKSQHFRCSSLCWDCKKATGFCSWSQKLKPVKGWTAKEEVYKNYFNGDEITYLVIKCPEFVEG